MSPTPLPPGLLGSQAPLSTAYDGALLDLDGVCFAGAARVPHAADSVNAARAAGMRLSFVTNNASRAPRTVVDKLRANDIQAEPGEVFSAAMDAAVMLTEHLAPGSLCLVVGGDGVRQALLDEGFTLTDTAADRPAAVVQGWDPAVDWAMLSEGLYAITAGALHVATNLDATLPTERGFALGNGSLVAAIAHASGKEPLAGGKPFPGIYERALARSGATSPIAVGDRLNTDHVGARAASIPGLHVLTGVSTARDVILADPAERPAFLHTDLRGLIEAHPEPVSDGDWWRVGQESARVSGDRLELAGTGALEQPATVTLDAYRALAAAAWASETEDGPRRQDRESEHRAEGGAHLPRGVAHQRPPGQVPRPVRGQRHLDGLHPGGEPVHGHEEAARADEGEDGQEGEHETVNAPGEGPGEEPQRGCGDCGQHDEGQAGQHLGGAQGEVGEHGPAEQDRGLECDGLRDRRHRLADRPCQGAVRQDAHPQQCATDPVGVGLARDLQGDEAADCADAAGQEHRAEGDVGSGGRLGAPADQHDGAHRYQQRGACSGEARSQVRGRLPGGGAQDGLDGADAHGRGSLLTRER